MTLVTQDQADFSAGIFRAFARHLIPRNGCWDAVNALLTSDGSIFKRPGSAYLSTSAFGSAGLMTVWDGFLVPGQRTLIANAADYGTLDGSEGPINLGGPGLSSPGKPVEVGGIVYVDRVQWGGSRKTASYSAGTVSVTNGSATVTGSSTLWSANADAGMMFQRGSERRYVVQSVDGNTQITLAEPYQGATGSGAAYTLHHLFDSPGNAGIKVAVAANRLWVFVGKRASFSGVDSPDFAADDFHEFAGGVEVLGGAGIGDRLLAFTTDGVQMLSGLSYDLTDDFGNVQHRNEKVGGEILWGHEGVAEWRGALVVPCADDVYLMDGVSYPEPITRSITPMYREHVEAGHKPGLGAVFNSHYLLPILDSSNEWVDTLVSRLDRPTEVPGIGIVRPFTRWEDYGGEMSGFAVRTGGAVSARDPQLLGASLRSTSRVANLTGCFDIDGSKNEPDGSTHDWVVETRDYATGDGTAKSENTVRRVFLRYELVDAATDDPTIQGYWATSFVPTDASFYGSAFYGTGTYSDAETAGNVLMSGSAPEDDGRTPHWWNVNEKARFMRFRFKSSDPASRLVLRAVETKTRLTGKN